MTEQAIENTIEPTATEQPRGAGFGNQISKKVKRNTWVVPVVFTCILLLGVGYSGFKIYRNIRNTRIDDTQILAAKGAADSTVGKPQQNGGLPKPLGASGEAIDPENPNYRGREQEKLKSLMANGNTTPLEKPTLPGPPTVKDITGQKPAVANGSSEPNRPTNANYVVPSPPLNALDSPISPEIGMRNTSTSTIGSGNLPGPLANQTAAPNDQSNRNPIAALVNSTANMLPGNASANNAMSNGAGNTGMAANLVGTPTKKEIARSLGNPNFVLSKGNNIDCVLDRAIMSGVPMMISCGVTKNIYSVNGKVLLVERGSKVVGEATATLRSGQKRIFALWTRIETPHGIVVDINSPGTDALGRGGIDGQIDSHWFERFGNAYLISIVQDAVGVVAAQSGSPSSGVAFQNTQNTGNQLAAEILKDSITIPPTLLKNQGERIAIFVARDLDFSNVYDLAVH